MKTTKILLFSLLSLTFLLGGCAKQNAIIEAQNQLVEIESSLVDQYNVAEEVEEAADILASAIRRMQRIDISNCPQDYQNAWDDIIDHWTKWERICRSGDIDTAFTFASQSATIVSRLNPIAKSHGVTVYD
jgi:PBP1b-binding outer membrane lipoprotein LpoB